VAMRQASLWVEYERQTEILQRFQQPLSASFDAAQFGAIIESTLPRLHVDTFWLSLYESSDTNTKGLAYPLLQFEAHDADRHSLRVFDKEKTPAFPARELIPGKLRDGNRAYQMNIFPLSFEQEHFGFALFNINNQNANILEILNSQMTALIKGFRLIEEARHYTDKLENDVAARTTELRRANDLLVNQNKEIEKLNHELVQKNKVDVLTDLYNRGALFELLKMELNRTRRNRQRVQGKLPGASPNSDYQTFSIMMCDLDQFKHINDTYGHLVGDQVLRYIGELLKEAHVLRQEDVAGRFGGEEFIVVLTNTDADNALYPARRFVEQLKKKIFHGKDGQAFSVTASVGISQFHDDDQNEEAVIQRADQALYHAKNHGRDQIVIFEKIS
jgi:diguanylate cyclase (GGDEF)-like protein